MQQGIPQVLAVVKATRQRKIVIGRSVREHLGVKAGSLFLHVNKEVLLTTRKAKGARPAEVRANRLCLSEEVFARLALEGDCRIAIIQRDDAVAIKKLVIKSAAGEQASVTDVETPLTVVRSVVTHMLPDELLPRLQKRYAKKKLKRDVSRFVRGRPGFEAWVVRQLLGKPDSDDLTAKKNMIAERLESQLSNGSWDGKVMLTARRLGELCDLGVSARRKGMVAGVKWLLARDKSPVNLGMFFLTDELVQKQRDCLRERKRFRDRKPAELAMNAEGDPMVRESCGPRILWPNGVVLDALVRLGYEKHKRVQTALKSTVLVPWCECGAQAGHGIRTKTGVLSRAQIDKAIAARIVSQRSREMDRYTYAGIEGTDGLLYVDPHLGAVLGRTAHEKKRGRDTYPLRMPSYVGTCEIYCMRAFWHVADTRLREAAVLHTAALVGRQRADGTIDAGRSDRFLFNSQAVFLHTLANFDCPFSRVGVNRFIPWIIAAQNRDGSWGADPHKDVTTLMVIQALMKARHYLPAGLTP